VIDLNAPLRAQPLPKSGLLKIRHKFGRRTFVEIVSWQQCHREGRLGGFSTGAREFIERNLKHRAPIETSRFHEVPNVERDAIIAAIEASAIEPALDPPTEALEFID
jgi:hypothetical protein